MIIKKHNTCSKSKKNNKGKGKEGNELTGVNRNKEEFDGGIEVLNNNGPKPWVNFEIKDKGQPGHVNKNQSALGSLGKSNDTMKQQFTMIQKGIEDLGKRLAILENKEQQKKLHSNES